MSSLSGICRRGGFPDPRMKSTNPVVSGADLNPLLKSSGSQFLAIIDGTFVTLRIAEAFGKDGTVSVFSLEVIRKPTQGEPQTQRPRDRYQWRLRVGHLAPRVTDETRILKRSPIRILPSVCSCEQALPAKATTRAKAELWYFPSFLRTSIECKTKSR